MCGKTKKKESISISIIDFRKCNLHYRNRYWISFGGSRELHEINKFD